jgi:hypothetical protein
MSGSASGRKGERIGAALSLHPAPRAAPQRASRGGASLSLPPRKRWEGKDSRSRDAAERPSYGTPLSEVVTTGLDPVVHAEATRPNAGGKRCASEASAWMPSIGERSDAVLRTAMPGHDEEKNGRTKKIRRRNADRRKTLLPWLRPRPRLKREAHIYRRSTAVLAPRSVSSQGTQPQARLPGTRPRSSLSGCYPPLPVPVQR